MKHTSASPVFYVSTNHQTRDGLCALLASFMTDYVNLEFI